MEDDRYTVTIYVAAPGTPLVLETPGSTSEPGHMFYTTSNGHDESQSYGFAPIQQGSVDGAGHVLHNDVENYAKPVYARTMEVSKIQYDELNEFGQNPEKFGFDTYYKDVRHNCVDFTWAGLNHAGIERHRHMDVALPAMPFGPSIRLGMPGYGAGKSAFRPAENVDDVKSIEDPIPGSHLNSDHSNPMPRHRSILQHLLSEQRLDDPAHPDYALYQQARAGVHKIDAEHDRVSNVQSDNLAASLVVAARASGMNQIDHVFVGRDAERMFAVEGDLNSLHWLDRRLVYVETMGALNTPIAQSSANWGQAMQHGQHLQVQAQSQQQEFAQNMALQQLGTPEGLVM